MFNKRKFFSILLPIVLILTLYGILNIKVPTRYGINLYGKDVSYIEEKIPLYVKFIHFLNRHYQYKALANKITDGCDLKIEKVLAIFKWTGENIKGTIPFGWPIIDDHPINIVIRGYGTDDQLADVFATLCEYAGIPATMLWITPKGSQAKRCVAAICLDRRWLLFDPFYRNYFQNEADQLASIEDIISDPSILRQPVHIYKNEFPNLDIESYVAYFDNLTPIDFKDINPRRTRLQMPLPRLRYEFSKLLKMWRQ